LGGGGGPLLASSIISLSSEANPAITGQAVTFVVSITADDPTLGTPTGTVTFMDGNMNLGTSTLDIGGNVGIAQTTFTISTLSVGDHSITAVYNGDANFDPVTSDPVDQTINQDTTTTTLSSSLTPSTKGTAVTFTAIVRPTTSEAGTPTGTIDFQDGGTVFQTVSLTPYAFSAAQATFTTSTLDVGDHPITAGTRISSPPLRMA
jgi:hypothetical protein